MADPKHHTLRDANGDPVADLAFNGVNSLIIQQDDDILIVSGLDARDFALKLLAFIIECEVAA